MIRRAATVTGRVQGVSYRYHAVERARALGLTGWVRNTAVDTVELEVQGDPSAVDTLLAWAETGPTAAAVDRLVVQPRTVVETEHDFRITG